MVRCKCISYHFECSEKSITYANDALGSDELDQLIRNTSLRVALAISLEVTQVTNVADLVGRSAMILAVGIDYRVG
jgi:hypothetical protein